MSTRAIIAMPTQKGYITAWCWNDGGPDNLGRELRKYFRDKESAKQLISIHSFSTICGPRTIEEFMKDGDTAVALSNLRYALVHPHQGKVVAGTGKYGFFRTIQEMLEQDLNYVYIFDEAGWKMYK